MQVLVRMKRQALGMSLRQFAPLIPLDFTRLWWREHHPDTWALSELEKCCHIFGVPLCELVIFDPPPAQHREESVP